MDRREPDMPETAMDTICNVVIMVSVVALGLVFVLAAIGF